MSVSDYYCPTTVTSTISNGLGRGVRAVQEVVTVATVNPVKASAAVGAAWGAVAALLNARKYKRGQMSGRDAVLDTAGEGAGMGLSAGIGLLASNAVRTSLVGLSAASVVPFTVGLVVTASSKVVWNCLTRRHLKCHVSAEGKGATWPSNT